MKSKTLLRFVQVLLLLGALMFLRIPVVHSNPVIPDPDNDGLTMSQEALLGTDGYNSDSDGDGVQDGVEVALGRSPRVSDGTTVVPGLMVFTPLK